MACTGTSIVCAPAFSKFRVTWIFFQASSGPVRPISMMCLPPGFSSSVPTAGDLPALGVVHHLHDAVLVHGLVKLDGLGGRAKHRHESICRLTVVDNGREGAARLGARWGCARNASLTTTPPLAGTQAATSSDAMHIRPTTMRCWRYRMVKAPSMTMVWCEAAI